MDQKAIEVVQGELVVPTIPTTPMPSKTCITVAGAPVVGTYHETIRLRVGNESDLPWVDSLQKRQRHELGFLPMTALREKIAREEVLVATVMDRPVGYLIGSDRYTKRDEVGLIVQVNVEPKYRRSLVAAKLVQGQFDRSAYGCRLYSCWCAQDLDANRFWESMGFVAIAFRKGRKDRKLEGGSLKLEESESSDSNPSGFKLPPSSFPATRVHLFWQKRIRPGDHHTPWWYPSKTEGGQMRADRVALPIPPGVHWSEVEAVHVPEVEIAPKPEEKDWEADTEEEAIAEAEKKDRLVWPRGIEDRDGVPYRRGKRLATVDMLVKEQGAGHSGHWVIPDDVQVVDELPVAKLVRGRVGRRKKAKRVKPKKVVDPKFVAMARELRDRFLEEVERDPALIALPAAKHDVTRQARAETRAVLPLAKQLKALPKLAA
ncbi:MAG: GNAT family N-acetyltransferase [Planctomycetota bacterium]